MKKHSHLHRKRRRLARLPSLLRPTRKVWREGHVEQFLLSLCYVLNGSGGEDGCVLLATSVFPESRMHNERCTSGSEGGHQNPTVETPHGADARPY